MNNSLLRLGLWSDSDESDSLDLSNPNPNDFTPNCDSIEDFITKTKTPDDLPKPSTSYEDLPLYKLSQTLPYYSPNNSVTTSSQASSPLCSSFSTGNEYPEKTSNIPSLGVPYQYFQVSSRNHRDRAESELLSPPQMPFSYIYDVSRKFSDDVTQPQSRASHHILIKPGDSFSDFTDERAINPTSFTPRSKHHRLTVNFDVLRPNHGVPLTQQRTQYRRHRRTIRHSRKINNHTFDIYDLISQEFYLGKIYDKKSLLKMLSQYNILEFAKSNFREHHRGSVFQKKVIPISDLISFSFNPLKKPLLKSVPKENKNDASKLSMLILEYSNEKQFSTAVESIIKILKMSPVLIDEIYFQLIKQTTNNFVQRRLYKVWELFYIISSIFPISESNYLRVLSHIAKNCFSTDTNISLISFCTFLKFETRFYNAKISLPKINNEIIIKTLQTIEEPTLIFFNSTLYEQMWSQRIKYPKLPIPYMLYYIIHCLLKKKCYKTKKIFYINGNEELIEATVKQEYLSINLVSSANTHDLANILLKWLATLSIPLLPISIFDEFLNLASKRKYFEVLKILPKIHLNTLMYVIGFLKDLAKNKKETEIGKRKLAEMFGPLLVKAGERFRSPKVMRNLELLATGFVLKLIKEWNTDSIYPL